MTFSVLVAEPTAGWLGAATASRSLGVGNGVPAVWPGVGAAVSQSWTNRSLRGRALAAVAAGAPPEEALAAALATDPGASLRQAAVVTVTGEVADFTGEECSAWAGARVVSGADGGGLRGLACGNLLADARTLEDAVSVLDAARPRDPADLAAVLLHALRAGQRAGGDVRGEQSAAVVVGAGGAQQWHPPDLDVDLRVDDHERPLDELGRLLGLLRPRTA